MGRSRPDVVPAGIAGRRGSTATRVLFSANGIPVIPIDAPPAVVRRISTERRDIRERPPLRPSRGERFSPFAGTAQTANFTQPDACEQRCGTSNELCAKTCGRETLLACEGASDKHLAIAKGAILALCSATLATLESVV